MVLHQQRLLGTDVVDEDMTRSSAHTHVQAISELKGRDRGKLLDARQLHGHIQGGAALLRPRVPGLHGALFRAREQEMVLGIHFAGVQAAAIRFKGLKELATLQVKPVNILAHAHNEHVATGLVVLHVPPESRNPQPVVPPVGRMDLHVSVALQEHHLAVVLADHFKGGHLGVEAALEFDGQVGHLEALDAGLVGAGGQDVLLVGAHPDAGAHAGHFKVLDELDLAPGVHLLLQLRPLAAIREPL